MGRLKNLSEQTPAGLEVSQMSENPYLIDDISQLNNY